MLLRISLIVAIVAGLAAAGISHFMVAPKIQGLQTDLKTTQDDLARTKDSERKFRKEASDTKEKLDVANKELDETTNALTRVTNKALEQEKRANRLAGELEATTKERNDSQTELATWKATGLTADQVKATIDSLKKVSTERDVFAQENTVLLRNNNQLQDRLNQYINPNIDPIMRVGLKGKVIAVDRKWNFVVLDIGMEQGAKERGVFLVNRDGHLVGKVRVSTLEANRSIANVMPESQQADIKEGDLVLY